METLMLLSGIALLIGGAMFTWVTLANRRGGKAWRGSALLSGATLLYAGDLQPSDDARRRLGRCRRGADVGGRLCRVA